MVFRYTTKPDSDWYPAVRPRGRQCREVNPDLASRGEQGKPYSVRYGSTNQSFFSWLECRDKGQGIKITCCLAKLHSKPCNRVYHH